MIDRLIVHLGHDKTGTASLRYTFSTNGPALEAAGLVYPRLDPTRPRWEHDDVSEEFGADGKPFAPGPNWAKFSQIVLASGCRTALLSSEFLFRLPREQVCSAPTVFGTLARRVDILVYVRHPVHYANSAVSQAMRHGRPLSDLIEHPFTVDVRGTLERWRKGLRSTGVAGEVLVRPYRRDCETDWSIVNDVLPVCGVDPATVALTYGPPDENPSLSVLGVYLMDWINRNVDRTQIERGSLLPFEALRGPAYVLPADAMERARRQSAPALAWLAGNFGVELAERPLTPSPPCPLSERELASLAKLMLGTTQFNYEVERSRLGRWLGLCAPGSARMAGGRIHQGLKALGLADRILGEGGRRAVSVEKRLGSTVSR